MEMKRIGKLIGLAVVAVVMMFAAAGCVSMSKDYGVYDKSVPKDQMSDFTFSAVTIKSFNGKPVDWGRKAMNMGSIKLPAGTHDFVFDYIWEETNSMYNTITTTTRTINDLEISQFEFLPGHAYQLVGVLLGGKAMIILEETRKAPKISKTPTVFEGNWKGADNTTFKFAGNTWEMTLPPGTIVRFSYINHTATDTMKQKGTFEINGDRITLYLTHSSWKGRLGSVSQYKSANSRPYSFEGENLNLGRSNLISRTYSIVGNQAKLLNSSEELPPIIVYTKQ